MLKINHINDRTSVSFSNLLVIILVIFSNRTNMVYGANINWVEVSKTPLGIEYIDKDSITNKDKGVIEIKTKYLKRNSNTSNEIEVNIYTMKINCINNKFKDISVNGKRNITAKWQKTNGDKLINDLISYGCENI